MHTNLLVIVLAMVGVAAHAAPKTQSTFFPPRLVDNARRNAEQFDWAAKMRQHAVDKAKPWLKYSDDQLWQAVFGHRIDRSWMVWSNGHCPDCKKSVTMYNWKFDALNHPWKVQCPECNQRFPTNDFEAFHRSGLDEHGFFDPDRADRSLLKNPDAKRPDFAVDDGTGYVEGKHRWRFIGTYLIYGHWRQLILAGIRNLSAAYLVTGDRTYARKAAILIDRIADVHHEFDFKEQAWVYERRGDAGYISTWHDACEEVRQIAYGYDMIFDAIKDDPQLVEFLSAKAKRHKLDNPKTSFELIQKNIEERLFRDVIKSRWKIESNYPTTDVTLLVMRTVMDWHHDRDGILETMDAMLRKATAVDGLSGEKGLAGYSAISPNNVVHLLGWYDRFDPQFLPQVLERVPNLRKTYRFHIDTWVDQRYYPHVGDSGVAGHPYPRWAAVQFKDSRWTPQPGVINPSAYTVLWKLAKLIDEPALLQVLYYANENNAQGLPHDLLADDPAQVQHDVQAAVNKLGATIDVASIDLQQWHIALLRTGGATVWTSYDVRGGHGHYNGLNLGLFAKGLDLMPEFGYPPVQYGGWGSPRAQWYTMSAAHNTVVVDGKNHIADKVAKTTLWATGEHVQIMRHAGAAMIGGEKFDRTVVLVDTSEKDAYVLDVFRVAGGNDHALFMHGYFGEMTTTGLSLQPTEDYGHGTQMRNFQMDAAPSAGWAADWRAHDYYKVFDKPRDVHLRYTSLTADAEAYTCEAWVAPTVGYKAKDAYIPRIVVRRRNKEASLASTFVGVIEPYEGEPLIKSAKRLPGDVAVEVTLADGRRDVIIAHDKAGGKTTNGEFAFVRFDANGKPIHAVLCRGDFLEAGELKINLKEKLEHHEWSR